MQIDYPQLAALVAVVREGTFDAAARALHITPSAVSQRIKLLEEQVGAVLIVRGAPCSTTVTGEALYRHGLQVELLEKDLVRAVGSVGKDGSQEPAEVAIAVNADSLATWLVPAISGFVEATGHRVEIVVDDQDHTAGWLRNGRVLGAVTTEAKAVQGCRVEPLGVMRYRATATPRFVRRWFPDGFTKSAVAHAPVLVFNRKDLLQQHFVADTVGPRVLLLKEHSIPLPHALVEGCLLGLGWGLNPEALVEAHLRKGRLLELVPDRWLDVPLYWQYWAIASSSLQALGLAMRTQAKNSLHPL